MNKEYKHAAEMLGDAIQAAVMQMNDEKYFESELERRKFWRFAALVKRHIGRELHTGIDESKVDA